MLSFTVRMRFDEPDHDAIRAHLIALTKASRQEPGCVTYVAHFLSDDPTTVLIYEQYRDEAALDHHRNTPHFAEHGIGGLYQRMRERSLENLTAVEP
jgi:quinol monooxygenase YgiN